MCSRPKIGPNIELWKWPSISKEWDIALQEIIHICLHEKTGRAVKE